METSVRVIEPAGGLRFPDLRELWDHRDLIYYLARRDVVVRYKQAVVGALWAVLQPVMIAAVFSVFLGLLAKVPSQAGIPYPLFALSGMVMWLFFARALEQVSSSTVDSEALISKIYFPRIVIPIAAIFAPAVDFLIGVVVVIAVAAAYGFAPGLTLLGFPLAFALATLTAVGVGLWLSALNVRYRDIRLVVPFALLLGLFMTPITYPFDLVPEHLQALYSLNPMVGVIEAFRWSVLGTDWPGTLLLVPVAMSTVLLVTGALYFQHSERGFADVI
jgi:lipopolysaccharide transport system permease protein